LVEQIALEPVRIAVAGPSLETKEWRAGPCPQRGVRKARVLHRNRRARRVDEGERSARAIEEAKGVASEQFIGELEIAAMKRNRPPGFLDQPARRQARTLGLPLLLETDKSPVAPRRAERPAEAGMQPASVRSRSVAGIGDFDRDFERVGA